MILNLKEPIEFNRSNYRSAKVDSVNNETKRAVISYTERNGVSSTVTINSETGVKDGDEASDNPLRVRNMSKAPPKEVFRIFFGRDDWTKEQWRFVGGDEHEFEEGKAASEKAKEYSALAKDTGSPWRFMVKRDMENVSDSNWKQWMQQRFASGEYTPVPWKDEDWFQTLKNEHFTHLSLADSFQLAYVASENDGVLDKNTVITPGKYLQQFFGSVLKPQEIAKWVAAVDKECELLFATSPEDIEMVYTTSGINSCMCYTADRFTTGGVHPTRMYGAGDLAIAYLTRKKKIIARALVYPEKMIYGRVYGDNERLVNRLVGAGYKDGAGSASCFDGAKMLRQFHGKYLILPYLDWNMRLAPHEDNRYLVLASGGPIGGGNTSGVADGSRLQSATCPRCSNEFNLNDSFYVVDRGRNFCRSCSRVATYVCDISGERFQITGEEARVGIYHPGNGDRIGWVAPRSLRDATDIIVKIGRKAYYTQHLKKNDAGKWVLPEERKAA